MFTGIIEEVGEVREVAPLEGGRRLRFAARSVLQDLRPGDSIAVDGVCLTAVDVAAEDFWADAVRTTLDRTTVGGFEVGRRVNLERALAAGGRIGGHFVQGHVDGVGVILAVEPRGEHTLLDVRLPDEVAEVTVPRGSLALDGVSMTVVELPEPDVARLSVIPFTWEHTNVRRLAPGGRVNLEGDMVGRAVVHYLRRTGAAS